MFKPGCLFSDKEKKTENKRKQNTINKEMRARQPVQGAP